MRSTARNRGESCKCRRNAMSSGDISQECRIHCRCASSNLSWMSLRIGRLLRSRGILDNLNFRLTKTIFEQTNKESAQCLAWPTIPLPFSIGIIEVDKKYVKTAGSMEERRTPVLQLAAQGSGAGPPTGSLRAEPGRARSGEDVTSPSRVMASAQDTGQQFRSSLHRCLPSLTE